MMKKLKIYFNLLFITLLVIGCQKETSDFVPDISTFEGEEYNSSSIKNEEVTIERAKKYFSRLEREKTNGVEREDCILPANTFPMWDFAKEVVFNTAIELVVVPVLPISDGVEWDRFNNSRLVFYEDEFSGGLESNLIVYHSSPNLYSDGAFPRNDNFSGIIYQIDEGGQLLHPTIAENGHFIGEISIDDFMSIIPDGVFETRDDEPDCYGRTKLDNFFEGIGDFFVNYLVILLIGGMVCLVIKMNGEELIRKRIIMMGILVEIGLE